MTDMTSHIANVRAEQRALQAITIDRMEIRQEILALDEKRKPLAEAVLSADDDLEDAIAAEVQREEEICEREVRERRAAFHKRVEEIRLAHGRTDDPQAALEAHDDAAAYAQVDDFDDEGLAVRCCLTGLPILDEDETVADSEGRKALVAAIPNWPGFGADGLPPGTIDAIADGEDAA